MRRAIDRGLPTAVSREGVRFLGLATLYQILVLALVLVGIQQAVLAQENSSKDQLGALLLKTDRVLVGKITRVGEVFKIGIAEDSSVSVPATNVVHVGSSLLDVYEFKKSKIKDWHGGDHFQLTHWCIANGLLGQAAEHYQAVSMQFPNHPRVKQLAVELKNKMLDVPEFRDFLGLPPKTQTVQHKPAPRTAKTESKVATVAGVGTAAMHPEITAHFARRIQPILMNRCSQSACHGPTSKNGLMILEPYRAAYERVTARNLESVLSKVSQNSKELSPLLRYATTAHGIQREPAIAITETQLLSELSSWIQFVQNPVSQAVAHQTPSTLRPVSRLGAMPPPIEPFSAAIQLVPVQPGASGLKPVPQKSLQAQDFPNGDMPLANEIEALDQQLRQILGEPSRGPVPVPPQSGNGMPRSQDAFDPAEFNQRPSPR